MDVVDPQDAPGVGTPVRGGVTYREAHLAMEMIYEARVMRSLEVVEVNPILDQQNATAELAVELVLSANGKADHLTIYVPSSISVRKGFNPSKLTILFLRCQNNPVQNVGLRYSMTPQPRDTRARGVVCTLQKTNW